MELPYVTMRVRCGKGTYIRSLCRDIGDALGCGACMDSLVRTKVGQFTIEAARPLREIEELVRAGTLSDALVPIDAMQPGSGQRAGGTGGMERRGICSDL